MTERLPLVPHAGPRYQRRAHIPPGPSQFTDSAGRPTRVLLTLLAELVRHDVVWSEADPIAISNGTTTAVAHGLITDGGNATKPAKFWADLICTTTEYGYAVDDEVEAPSFESANNRGVAVGADSENFHITVGANGIYIARRDGGNVGQSVALTPASWRIRLKGLW
jgi:hypothetical protein